MVTVMMNKNEERNLQQPNNTNQADLVFDMDNNGDLKPQEEKRNKNKVANG